MTSTLRRVDNFPLNIVCPTCETGIGQACKDTRGGSFFREPYSFCEARALKADELKEQANKETPPKREPVNYRYDAILPEFLKMLARIGAYADEKYISWDQYMKARLEGEKAPLNHLREHLRQYEMGEPYDHFDGDLRWHLAAIAYNAMMEFFYHTRFGHVLHPSARRIDVADMARK